MSIKKKKKNLRRQYRWRESKRMRKGRRRRRRRRRKRKVELEEEEVKKTIQVKRKQKNEERYRQNGLGVLFSAQSTCDEPWQACGACLPGPASPWSAQSIPHCRCRPVSPPLQIHSWRVKTVRSVRQEHMKWKKSDTHLELVEIRSNAMKMAWISTTTVPVPPSCKV